MNAFLIFIFSAGLALAQTEDLDAKQKGFLDLTQSGKIFQVQLRPKAKDLHVFVTGIEAAAVKMEDSTIEATIGVGNQARKVIAEKVKDPETGKTYYRLANTQNTTEPLKLKIQSGDSQESFNFPPPK